MQPRAVPTIEAFEYEAPLAAPLTIDAYRAPAPDAAWRLVVFPGTPCRKQLFYRFLRLAPKDLEVVVMTRPGFAKDHPEPVLCFDEQIKAARPFLGDKKVITLGVSYGGALALKTALENPDEVYGAVTVAMLVTEPRTIVREFVDWGGRSGAVKYVPRKMRVAQAEVTGRRPQIGPLLDRLEGLKKPVEILHGDFDNLVPLSDAELLHSRLAGHGAFEKIPGGTHYLEIQYPKKLYAAVERVMARAMSPDFGDKVN